MTASPDDLFQRLDMLGIEVTTTWHEAVFTVAESQALRGRIPGGHCKSLFLKDKKGALWLVVVDEDRQVDLKGLAKRLGAKNFSFGKPDLLEEVLGVTPGTVTPFALINDTDGRVCVALDAAMMRRDRLNYHPLDNRATTTIASADLRRFIEATGHQAYIIDFESPADAAG